MNNIIDGFIFMFSFGSFLLGVLIGLGLIVGLVSLVIWGVTKIMEL